MWGLTKCGPNNAIELYKKNEFQIKQFKAMSFDGLSYSFLMPSSIPFKESKAINSLLPMHQIKSSYNNASIINSPVVVTTNRYNFGYRIHQLIVYYR